MLEECFQTPVEGAIYAEIIDRLRAQGAIRRAEVDNSALVHTLGPRIATQHRHLVFPDRGPRDPRHRLR